METLLQALRPLFASAFTLWGAPASWLELIAFVLALAMVGFNIRVNPLGWPLAIASSLLYFALFWDSRLYGEANLQIFFVVVALWGWWQWLRGTQDDGTALRVRSLGRRGLIGCAAAMALAWPLLGAFLARVTDSDVPWWDAFPTAGSLVGQWLLGRKYVENWPVWLLVNVVSVALFAYKGLWLTVVLYAVFVLLSLAGWRAWSALARTEAR
ncbi:MAG TPA: nicotinamide riboside transporter PnuC [Piscinibacter sp.]|jgi:nicotinamide mononucleotide transporter|nr:nicotinamide riboside transporter PnuC [Piscinibacter sp.]HPG79998.1 nicotinamide riboside transporter PnuC [Piscinibacter sp.]HPM68543.1 nicotinamide riboside transporter PnuC [Piscinibacter sp.]